MSDPTKGLDVDSPWETRRLPDAVRAAALANAVDFFSGRTVTMDNVGMVLDLARTFENYLTGEETG